MDPAQRILLEDTVGLLPPDTPSSQTAVSVAIAKLGEPSVVAAGNAAAVAAGSSFVGTGRALSAAAGRISYVYGLRGPSSERGPLRLWCCSPHCRLPLKHATLAQSRWTRHAAAVWWARTTRAWRSRLATAPGEWVCRGCVG